MPSWGLLGIYGRVSRVPPHVAGGSSPPGGHELEELEELGDDAIIAQQTAAHSPQPRAQVTEEARSVVISDHPPQRGPSSKPPAGKRRSERTEKTVVIRDRRQVEDLRREMERRKAQAVPASPAGKGIWLWVAVGVAAFLMGGLVALFATGEDTAQVAPLSSSAAPAAPAPTPAPTPLEPPSVSIDELPIEGSKKN